MFRNIDNYGTAHQRLKASSLLGAPFGDELPVADDDLDPGCFYYLPGLGLYTWTGVLWEPVGSNTLPEHVVTEADPEIYTIPASYLLEKIIVKPNGDAVGALIEDLVGAEDVTEADGVVWIVNQMAWADRNLSIQNLPIGSDLYFLKTKIL